MPRCPSPAPYWAQANPITVGKASHSGRCEQSLGAGLAVCVIGAITKLLSTQQMLPEGYATHQPLGRLAVDPGLAPRGVASRVDRSYLESTGTSTSPPRLTSKITTTSA